MDTFVKNPLIVKILENHLYEREMIQIYVSHSIHKITRKPIALIKLSIISEDFDDDSAEDSFSEDRPTPDSSEEKDSFTYESESGVINWSTLPKIGNWGDYMTDSSDESD